MKKVINMPTEIEILDVNADFCSKNCPFIMESSKRKSAKCLRFLSVKLETIAEEFHRCEKCLEG